MPVFLSVAPVWERAAELAEERARAATQAGDVTAARWLRSLANSYRTLAGLDRRELGADDTPTVAAVWPDE